MIETRRLLPLLPAAALLVLSYQAADLLALLPGVDLEVPAGRIRQLLAVESRGLAAVTADLLLIWSLVLLRRQRALRALGTAHWVIGALLVVAAPLFLRDAAALAAGFAGAGQDAFRVVVARMVLMLIGLGILAGLTGKALHAASRETGGPE